MWAPENSERRWMIATQVSMQPRTPTLLAAPRAWVCFNEEDVPI